MISRALRYIGIFVLLCAVCVPVHADDLKERLALAEQIQALRPVKDQVDGAIARYVMVLPPGQQDEARAALQDILNYKALEKISIDAYAEIYTQEELAAMLEYYRKPEALSALGKLDQYAGRIYPEIMQMLDKAMMRLKTGG